MKVLDKFQIVQSFIIDNLHFHTGDILTIAHVETDRVIVVLPDNYSGWPLTDERNHDAFRYGVLHLFPEKDGWWIDISKLLSYCVLVESPSEYKVISDIKIRKILAKMNVTICKYNVHRNKPYPLFSEEKTQ